MRVCLNGEGDGAHDVCMLQGVQALAGVGVPYLGGKVCGCCCGDGGVGGEPGLPDCTLEAEECSNPGWVLLVKWTVGLDRSLWGAEGRGVTYQSPVIPSRSMGLLSGELVSLFVIVHYFFFDMKYLPLHAEIK